MDAPMSSNRARGNGFKLLDDKGTQTKVGQTQIMERGFKLENSAPQ
jgi:hypothetical protein